MASAATAPASPKQARGTPTKATRARNAKATKPKTCIASSAVIDQGIEVVWAVLRPLDFSFLTPRCRSSQARGIVRAVELYDDTPTAKPSKACHGGEARDEGVQTSPRERKLHKVIKARITQLLDARFTIAWNTFDTLPSTLLVVRDDTIQLRRVTDSGTTFIEWTTTLDCDSADAATVAAVKREHLEAFNHMRSTIVKQPGDPSTIAMSRLVEAASEPPEIDYIPKRGGASPTPVGHFMREQEFIKAAERVGVPQSEAQTLLWDTSASVVSVFVLLEAARSLQETATSEPKTAARIMEVVSTLFDPLALTRQLASLKSSHTEGFYAAQLSSFVRAQFAGMGKRDPHFGVVRHIITALCPRLASQVWADCGALLSNV